MTRIMSRNPLLLRCPFRHSLVIKKTMTQVYEEQPTWKHNSGMVKEPLA